MVAGGRRRRFEPSGTHDAGSAGGQGQELVFIGTGLRADALHAALDACLVGADETGPWQDPFPAWDVHAVDDACEHEPEPDPAAAARR